MDRTTQSNIPSKESYSKAWFIVITFTFCLQILLFTSYSKANSTNRIWSDLSSPTQGSISVYGYGYSLSSIGEGDEKTVFLVLRLENRTTSSRSEYLRVMVPKSLREETSSYIGQSLEIKGEIKAVPQEDHDKLEIYRKLAMIGSYLSIKEPLDGSWNIYYISAESIKKLSAKNFPSNKSSGS